MNEIELQFHKENRDKKSIGNNIYKKAGGRGGKCRLPSDYLSNKEKRGLNGKVETVKLNEPMAYSDFKALSNTLKQEYLTNLVENHGARQADIAEMFNISRPVVNKLFKSIAQNVHFGKTGEKYPDKKWLDFIAAKDKEPTPEAPKEKQSTVSISEGSITFRGVPETIFETFKYLLDAKAEHEITINFRQI